MFLLYDDGDKTTWTTNMFLVHFSLNLSYNVISFHKQEKQSAVGLFITGMTLWFSKSKTYIFIHSVNKQFLLFDLLVDFWWVNYLFRVSSFLFLTLFFTHSILFLFSQTLQALFFLLTPASSPSVLSDLALCLSQSFFQLPVSHTLTVKSLSLSL